MDLSLNFQILLGQWEGVILKIQYELFRVFSPFLPKKNHARVVKFSYLNFEPLNLYPTLVLTVWVYRCSEDIKEKVHLIKGQGSRVT